MVTNNQLCPVCHYPLKNPSEPCEICQKKAYKELEDFTEEFSTPEEAEIQTSDYDIELLWEDALKPKEAETLSQNYKDTGSIVLAGLQDMGIVEKLHFPKLFTWD